MTMNKRCLVFVGPQHHMPLMRPLIAELEGRGWEMVYYTANTEACFQIGLGQEVGAGGYRWLPDYVDRPKAKRMYEGHVKQIQPWLEKENVLGMMLPQVLDRILMHTCEEWTATENLLREVRPARALALHEINRWGVMLGYWCQRGKVPLYTMQEGLYYGDPWIYTGHTTYGTSLVWGEGTKQKLVAAGCPAEKIVVVGHPDLAKRIAQGQSTMHPDPRAKGRRIALFLLAHVQLGEQAGNLLEGLGADWYVVVKPHPLAAQPDLEDIKKAFGGRDNCLVLPVDTPEEEKWQWVMQAEVCLVAGCSSVILECLAAGKKLGIIPTENMAHNYTMDGIAVSCTGMTIQNAIQKIRVEWGQCEEKAKAWVGQEATSLDAASKMADLVERG